MNNNNPPDEPDVDSPIDKDESTSVHDYARWELLRDVIVFQFKLALDGLRDLLLSPISIITAIFGLFFGGNKPGKNFYALLRWGHKSDEWISLFSASDDKYPQSGDAVKTQDMTTDSIVSHIEQVMKNEFKRGGLVSTTKKSIDGLFNRFRNKS